MKRIFKKLILAAPKGTIPKTKLVKYLPKNPIILEAGAYNGADTLDFCRVWPEATVYAFEPVPTVFQRLKENTAQHQQVKLFQEALGPRTGTIQMHISSGASAGSSSILTPKLHLKYHPDVEFKEDILVNVITLQDWGEREQVKKIDFLWLDLQGAELQVLQAAGELLNTVSVIHTEVSFGEIYENGADYSELKTWLEQAGFELIIESFPWPDMGNTVFVRKGLS